jgi:hypothetical protein
MASANKVVHMFRPLLTAALLAAAACSSSDPGAGPQTVEGKSPDGTVEMTQVHAAYIGSGSGGHGTLFYKGQSYTFNVGGVGIGGIGVSTIDAKGEVYGLQNVLQFAGTYAQGRYGFAIGTLSAGDLWMKNENGVVLHLKAKREGLMLSLGGDAVAITMTQ